MPVTKCSGEERGNARACNSVTLNNIVRANNYFLAGTRATPAVGIKRPDFSVDSERERERPAPSFVRVPTRDATQRATFVRVIFVGRVPLRYGEVIAAILQIAA